MVTDKILDPKQTYPSYRFRTHWYPYYAGFSPLFTESVIRYLEIDDRKTIVDPWNGSGTTTFVAAKFGIQSIGIDLNPVMTIIAKARSATIEDYIYAKALALDAIANFDVTENVISEGEMLLKWFSYKTASLIRRLEKSVKRSRDIPDEFLKGGLINEPESLVYLALFRVVRGLVKDFIGTNDTWIKRNIEDRSKVDISRYDLIAYFAQETSHLFEDSVKEKSFKFQKPRFRTENSRNINISDDSADFIITSPPYCTRIDYAIKTSPELAIIGYNDIELDELRRSLMGTTTVPKVAGEVEAVWGETCNTFLQSLSSHKSKASSGYYYKSHYSYFQNLHLSLMEMRRILNSNGKAVLVIQDSYYKDLYNDVPQVICEMVENLGMLKEREFSFVKSHSMASMNKQSRQYRGSYKPTEKVLIISR